MGPNMSRTHRACVTRWVDLLSWPCHCYGGVANVICRQCFGREASPMWWFYLRFYIPPNIELFKILDFVVLSWIIIFKKINEFILKVISDELTSALSNWILGAHVLFCRFCDGGSFIWSGQQRKEWQLRPVVKANLFLLYSLTLAFEKS